MIPWKTFKFRRKLNLETLLKDEKISSYEKLVEYLHSLHVAPPSLEEYERVVPKAASSKSTPAKKASTTSRKTPTSKKTVKETPKPAEDPSEVWEAGLEGSYSEKKQAKTTTKRTTRRTRTTKKKS